MKIHNKVLQMKSKVTKFLTCSCCMFRPTAGKEKLLVKAPTWTGKLEEVYVGNAINNVVLLLRKDRKNTKNICHFCIVISINCNSIEMTVLKTNKIPLSILNLKNVQRGKPKHCLLK